jgi:hypothetical protein
MAVERTLPLHGELPDRYARFEVLASTVDHRGRIVALVADPAQGFTPVPYSSSRRPPPRYEAIAVISEGGEVCEIPLKGLDRWFTLIDTLGEGVVLADARCDPPGVPFERYTEAIPEEELHLTANVRVVGADGETRSAFYAGDGIEQLVTDARGGIWTGYFDESNYWSPHPDGTRSYSFMVGLARWAADGGPPWMAPSETPGLAWCDCYALNVGRDLVHACPYNDFPLVEIGDGGVRAVLPNPVTRCSGLAVLDQELAFFDQHQVDGRFQWEIRRARKEDSAVVETGREHLRLPDGRELSGWARGKIGRDGTLWLHEDGDPRRWYRYELDA